MSTEKRSIIAGVIITLAGIVAVTTMVLDVNDTLTLTAAVVFYTIMLPTLVWGLIGGKR